MTLQEAKRSDYAHGPKLNGFFLGIFLEIIFSSKIIGAAISNQNILKRERDGFL